VNDFDRTFAIGAAERLRRPAVGAIKEGDACGHRSLRVIASHPERQPLDGFLRAFTRELPHFVVFFWASMRIARLAFLKRHRFSHDSAC
jgi:hypothetical protein